MQNANFNLGGMIDPSITTDQLALARNQAMAQALQQQGMTPIDANRKYKISPYEGLAKLAQVLAAGKMNESNDKSQAALSQKNMQALASMLPRRDPTATQQSPQMVPDANMESQGQNAYVPPPASSNPPQNGGANNNFGLANLLRGSAIGQFGGDAAEKAFYADQARTEAAKRGAELGLTNQEQADAVRAENSVKGTLVTRKGSLPLQADPNNPGAMRAVPGSLDALISAARQEAQVHNENTLAPMQYSANGNPAPTQTIAQTLSANNPAMQPPMQQQAPQSPLQQPGMMNAGNIPPEVMAAAKSGAGFHMTQNPDGSMQNIPIPRSSGGGGVYGAPPLGAVTGADAAQNELSKKYTTLSDQNREAQNTTSYLQSIKALAAKAATGPQSDKLQFVNGLLGLVGYEKATDAITANSLMDKYSKQIVARLGQGGLGTDAARSILESAYPNSKMNVPAIHEAVDNLVGANEMVKAKNRLLGPHGDARDPIGYAQKERAFDQAADPRVFQLQSMSPQAQIEYVKKLPPEVARQIIQQRQALKQLGVIQ